MQECASQSTTLSFFDFQSRSSKSESARSSPTKAKKPPRRRFSLFGDTSKTGECHRLFAMGRLCHLKFGSALHGILATGCCPGDGTSRQTQGYAPDSAQVLYQWPVTEHDLVVMCGFALHRIAQNALYES